MGASPLLISRGEAKESLRRSNLWQEVKEELDKSTLDPISTAKIGELTQELKKEYPLFIVTNNMQEAHRVADYTAFMYLGRMEEVDPMLFLAIPSINLPKTT